MTEISTYGAPSPAPGSARYEALLAERVRQGLVYIDAVCHRSAFDDAERLFGHIADLEKKLSRFRRYSFDEYRIVTPAEDQRWHVPGQAPVGPQCLLCIKEQLLLPVDIVLAGRGDSRGRAA